MGLHISSNFKKRNSFSSRRSRFSHRPVANRDQIDLWETEMKYLLSQVTITRDRIVNCDETSWQLFLNVILTWADTGSDNIQTKFNGNVKDLITVMGTIPAANTKLLLHIIAKGNTERVESSQLDDISYHMWTHSTTAWTTGETFKDYLGFLSDYFQHQPIHLILDIFSVHRSPEIKEYARQLGITHHYIPARCTDKYQPLDRRVLCALKATSRHVFYAQYQETPEFQFSKQNAIEALVYAYKHLSIDVIEDSCFFFNQ